jgi:hypothetical protein
MEAAPQTMLASLTATLSPTAHPVGGGVQAVDNNIKITQSPFSEALLRLLGTRTGEPLGPEPVLTTAAAPDGEPLPDGTILPPVIQPGLPLPVIPGADLATTAAPSGVETMLVARSARTTPLLPGDSAGTSGEVDFDSGGLLRDGAGQKRPQDLLATLGLQRAVVPTVERDSGASLRFDLGAASRIDSGQPIQTLASVSHALATPPGDGTIADGASSTAMGSRFSLPMNQPGAWEPLMTQRIQWMVSHQVREAQIQLHPRELGSLHIKISVDGDQASVSFGSQHAFVRDALEAAAPRLREMLGAEGLQLSQYSVAHQHQGQQHPAGTHHPGQQHHAGSASNEAFPESVDEPLSALLTVRESSGLVDLYA